MLALNFLMMQDCVKWSRCRREGLDYSRKDQKQKFISKKFVGFVMDIVIWIVLIWYGYLKIYNQESVLVLVMFDVIWLRVLIEAATGNTQRN
jgi:hypothetical protein